MILMPAARTFFRLSSEMESNPKFTMPQTRLQTTSLTTSSSVSVLMLYMEIV